MSRSRWQIEQYYQRSKDDLGLDHFEGRSWRGFHHHLVLSSVAYLFVLIVYLRHRKTSGLTWEQTLREIRPFLVRWVGFCTCCHTKFSNVMEDTT